jgi:hypothetical protein
MRQRKPEKFAIYGENSMRNSELLSAAMMTATLLTSPSMARESQTVSQRLSANAPSLDEHTCCRNRPIDLRAAAERDVWGHWGAFYGPMVPTLP